MTQNARTILVTGGAGFIGSHFVNQRWRNYANDHIIVLDSLTYAGRLDRLAREVLDSPRFEFVRGDVIDEQLVFDVLRRVDTVVHFAAETHVPRSIVDNRIFVETDVLGTQVLLSGAVARGAGIERFVHISSSEVYGSACEAQMDEEHPLRPTTPYAAAKCGADRMVYAFATTYGLPAVILRPFNNFGPGQHLEKAIPRFITSTILDQPIVIHGAGMVSRDWTFVEDTCRAVERVLDAPVARVAGEVFNVGTGVATTVREVVDRIVALSTRTPPRIEYSCERPGQVERHCADTGKAERQLGFRAEVDLANGLAATYAWYANNRESWMNDLEMRAVPVRGADGSVIYW